MLLGVLANQNRRTCGPLLIFFFFFFFFPFVPPLQCRTIYSGHPRLVGLIILGHTSPPPFVVVVVVGASRLLQYQSLRCKQTVGLVSHIHYTYTTHTSRHVVLYTYHMYKLSFAYDPVRPFVRVYLLTFQSAIKTDDYCCSEGKKKLCMRNVNVNVNFFFFFSHYEMLEFFFFFPGVNAVTAATLHLLHSVASAFRVPRPYIRGHTTLTTYMYFKEREREREKVKGGGEPRKTFFCSRPNETCIIYRPNFASNKNKIF